MKRITLFILFLSLAFPSPGRAQTHSGGKAPTLVGYKLTAVKAAGSTRYTDKEIVAASGLQIGQTAADADFKEVAQRLGESGMFKNVTYSFSYSDMGVKLDLQLTDADQTKLVPAHFENFVWFTDAELLSHLQRRVPLFKQVLPVSGRLADRVNEALQQILTDNHLPGRVDFTRQGRLDGGDLTGIGYRVEEVSMKIRNLEFPGASPEQLAFLTAAVHKLIGVEYSRGALAAVAMLDLMPLYQQRGYLKAAFASSDAHAVKQSPAEGESHAEDEIVVDASLPVTPGKQYLVSGVTWKGNSAVTTDEASHLFHLPTGQPADAVRLAHDEESLTTLYRSRGYMTAQVAPEIQLDDAKSTVHYDMNVTEGDLYKMGELEILGVDTPSKDRLHEAWTLREGQTYDASYTRKFLDDAPRLLPRGLQYTFKIDEEIDRKGKTVDVTIHFKVQ